jgi:hypothetical protein
MALHTRRTFLRRTSLAGVSAVLAAAAPRARGRSTRWITTIPNVEVRDVSRPGDGTIAVVGNDPSGEGADSVVVGIGGDGEEAWRWHRNGESPVEEPRAAAASESGWYLTGPTADGDTAVLGLDGERSVEWMSTYEIEQAHSAFLVHSSDSLVFLVHNDYLPSRYSTTVAGINTKDGSKRWEREPLGEAYRIERAVEHRDGCVLGGSVSGSGGWVALLSTDGHLVWKHEYPEDKFHLASDIVVEQDWRIVAVGPQRNAADENVRLIALDSDGERAWEQPAVVETQDSAAIVERVRMIGEPDDGYTMATSFRDRSEMAVSKAANQGRVYWTEFVEPFDSTPDLHSLRSLGETYVLVGDMATATDGEPKAWAVGLERPLTETTPARTATPTRTATTSDLTTRPPTESTERPTVTPDRSTEASAGTTTISETATSGSGAGFGLLTALASVSVAALARRYRPNEAESRES